MNLMSLREKRVAIARDVVKQVKSKELVARNGFYVNQSSRRLVNGQPDDKQVNEILIEKNIRCEVCARGAMFIAGLKRFNNLKVKDIKDRDFNYTIREEYESSFFETHQLVLIERVFEARAFPNTEKLRGFVGYYHPKICRAASKYRQELSRSGDFGRTANLLIGIAKNIILNNGDFVIPRRIWREIGVSDKISGEINRVLSHQKLV
jgi:hypothetical protein